MTRTDYTHADNEKRGRNRWIKAPRSEADRWAPCRPDNWDATVPVRMRLAVHLNWPGRRKHRGSGGSRWSRSSWRPRAARTFFCLPPPAGRSLGFHFGLFSSAAAAAEQACQRCHDDSTDIPSSLSFCCPLSCLQSLLFLFFFFWKTTRIDCRLTIFQIKASAAAWPAEQKKVECLTVSAFEEARPAPNWQHATWPA